MTVSSNAAEELATLNAQVHALEQQLDEINESFDSGKVDEISLLTEVSLINAEMTRTVSRIIQLKSQGA